MYRKQFIPLPRIQRTHIQLNPSVQQYTELYSPCNYIHTRDGIEFECPKCGETVERHRGEAFNLIRLGVYEVRVGFNHCLSCCEPVFTVSCEQIRQYWSK